MFDTQKVFLKEFVEKVNYTECKELKNKFAHFHVCWQYIVFQINFLQKTFKKKSLGITNGAKHFRSGSGKTHCRALSGSKLFANVITISGEIFKSKHLI